MKTSSESGSHLVAVALFVVVLGVVGFAGYRVWQMQSQLPSGSETASVPSKITDKASLNQAATVLDQSSTQLDSSLNDASLNTYLKSLL